MRLSQKKYNQKLAEYFDSKDYFLESIEEQQARAKRLPSTARPVKIRKVVELPWQRLRAQQWNKSEHLFTELFFLEAKVECGMIRDLLSDFRESISAFPSDQEMIKILQLIERAIQKDLLFIAQYPINLFQCLWNTCWWYDRPEAAHHHIDIGNNILNTKGLIQPWLQSEIKLFKIMEKWHQQKEKLTPGFRWVRSMRPPANGLEQKLVVLSDYGITKYLAISSNGQILIRADEHKATLWDINNSKQIVILSDPKINFWGVSFNITQLALAFGIKEKKLIAFDLIHSSELAHYSLYSHEISCFGLSCNCEFICAGSVKELIFVWSVDGRLLKTIRTAQNSIGLKRITLNSNGDTVTGREETSNSLKCIAITPDGKIIAGLDETSLKLWNVNSTKLIFDYEIIASSLSFTPESYELALGGMDGQVSILDPFNLTWKEPLKGHKTQYPIRCITFSLDGNWIASAGFDMRVCIWNFKTRSLFKTFLGHSMTPEVVALSKDAHIIASGAWEGNVLVREIDFYSNLTEIHEHRDWIKNIIFSNFSRKFATTSEDKTVRIWDSSSGKMLQMLENSGYGLTFSSSGEIYASCNIEGDLFIRLSRTNGIIEEVWSLVRHNLHQSVSFSNDGQLVAFTADNKKTVILDWGSKKIVHNIPFESDYITFSPDGNWLACIKVVPDREDQKIIANNKTQIHLYNVKSGLKKKTLKCPIDQGLVRIIFSMDSKFIIFSSGNEFYIWDYVNDRYLKKWIGTSLDRAMSNGYWDECNNSNAKLFQLMAVFGSSPTVWNDEKDNCIYAYPNMVDEHIILKSNVILGTIAHRLEMLKMEGSLTELEHLHAKEPFDFWNEIIPKMASLTQIDPMTFAIFNFR